VLIVEDEEDIRVPYAEFLQREGCHVVQAMDGAEALALLRAGLAPSVIVLDLIMPNMNGWEFRRAQIQDARLAKFPVLVMSGAHQLTIDPAMRNISGYLRKPVRLDELLSAVEAHAV
jgi:CheY-like chemotaxis protein